MKGAYYTYLSPEAKDFTNRVLNKFGITKEELVSTRVRPVPQIKQVLYLFLVEKYNESNSAIGRYFNNNHATVIHSCKQARLIKEFKYDRYHYIYENIINIYNNNELYTNQLDVRFELNYRRYANR